MLNYTRSTMCINFYFSEYATWMGYWTRVGGHGAILLADVICFFVHYLVVKLQNYVELEIKLIL